MNTAAPAFAPKSLVRILFTGWLAAAACVAGAAEPATMPTYPPEAAAPERVAVGDATSRLLSLQRSGAAASAVPRPIPGPVAARSYQRYLKSFEHPIPERFDTTVGGTAQAGSGAR